MKSDYKAQLRSAPFASMATVNPLGYIGINAFPAFSAEEIYADDLQRRLVAAVGPPPPNPSKLDQLRGEPQLYLAPIGSKANDGQVPEPDPIDLMKSRNLHRQFLRAAADSEDVMTFANQYGVLTGGHSCILEVDARRAASCDIQFVEGRREFIDRETGTVFRPRVISNCDSLDLWIITRLEMTTLRDLWLGKSDPEAIEMIRSTARDQGLTEDQVARNLLQVNLNYQLSQHVVPRLKISSKQILLEPKNLLGALWAHFALEVASQNQPLRQCKHCGKLVPGRASKQFCDDACRMAYSRANRRQEQQT